LLKLVKYHKFTVALYIR